MEMLFSFTDRCQTGLSNRVAAGALGPRGVLVEPVGDQETVVRQAWPLKAPSLP